MKTLSELQLKIMNVLWEREEATVSDVVEALMHEKNLARTTVATVLSRLEKRGIIAHRKIEVSHIYYPLVKQETMQKKMVSRMVDSLFGGDVTELVSRLLSDSDYDADEIKEVVAMIKDYEVKHGDDR